MTSSGLATHDALRAVAARYAAGVDRRDRALFLSAFTDDAVMVVPSDRGGSMELKGLDEIGRVTEMIARYPRTFHLLGQARYAVDATHCTGELYCIAHHITPSGDSDLVMYVRYDDTYGVDAVGDWLIKCRHVQVDWTETRPLEWPREAKS